MDAYTSNTVQAADRVSAFLWKVYGWMAIGLGLTALVAFAVAGSPDLQRVLIADDALGWKSLDRHQRAPRKLPQ